MRKVQVLVIGYGPSGEVAARLLAEAGIDSLVVEENPNVVPIPRAAHFDGEIMRLFQRLDVDAPIAEIVQPAHGVDYLNAAGELLFRTARPQDRRQGWHDSCHFYQPHLDRILRESLLADGSVEVTLGKRVVSVTERDSDVAVVIEGPDGTETVLAEWVIAADGGSGKTRKQLGIAHRNYNADHAWLIIDVLLGEAVDLPERSTIIGDPRRPFIYVPCKFPHRRFEFKVLEGEDFTHLEQPEQVWSLLSPYLTEDQAELLRADVYYFRGLIAEHWRKGRVFLAGDAAHMMPPYVGQGMCSGIRDVANIIWKLRLVLAGLADEALLDSYELEREPHVRWLVESSTAIGERVAITDPDAAAARDAEYLSHETPPVYNAQPIPGIEGGLVADESDGPLAPGELSDQPRILRGAEEVLFDDVAGAGFVLVGPPGLTRSLARSELAYLASIDCRVVELAAVGTEAALNCELTLATDRPWASRLLEGVTLIRPDRYVYGSVRNIQRVPELIESLKDDLASGTMRTPARAGRETLELLAE